MFDLREHNSCLVAPLRDIDGRLQTLHFINADGDKKFLRGRPVVGNFYSIGEIKDAVLIAEGVATALSLHQATSLPVVAAIPSNNLVPVAKAIRARYPAVRIVICADNDARTAAKRGRNPGVYYACKAAALSNAEVIVPDFSHCRKLLRLSNPTDFNDMALLQGLQFVKQYVSNAMKESRLHPISLKAFLEMDFPPLEMMLDPWLTTQSINLIFARTGVGKSWLAMGIAIAVATGSPFMRGKGGKRNSVLYVDGEMTGPDVQGRMEKICDSFGVAAPDDEFFRIITRQTEPGGVIPDLATKAGRDAIEAVLGSAKLLVLDNLSSLMQGSEKENDSESWRDMNAWLMQLRALGTTILVVHHAGKNGDQRGTSKRLDSLNVALKLVRPSDFTPDEGARFEVRFEKGRSLHGDDLRPLEVSIQSLPSGKIKWKFTDGAIPEEELLQLLRAGFSQREIAKRMKTSLATVNRRIRGLREAGVIKSVRGGGYQDEREAGEDRGQK